MDHGRLTDADAEALQRTFRTLAELADNRQEGERHAVFGSPIVDGDRTYSGCERALRSAVATVIARGVGGGMTASRWASS